LHACRILHEAKSVRHVQRAVVDGRRDLDSPLRLEQHVESAHRFHRRF
jgi:hypothetical protein